MKKISILLMCVALMGLSSCSIFSGATNSTAATSGAACSKALLALNKSRNAGTLAITNPTDLSNMIVVLGAYNDLKANKDNSGYRQSFTSGLVTGGSGLITAAQAANITSGLLNASGLDGVTASNISQKAQTVNTIIQLLTLLKS